MLDVLRPRAARGGTATFAVDAFVLTLTFHDDPSKGLQVEAVGGTAMALFGGNLSLTPQISEAIRAALPT